MPNQPQFTVTVEGMPGPHGLDDRAYAEIHARVAHASNPESCLPEDHPAFYRPTEITVVVVEDNGEYENMSELEHKWVPGNGSGMYTTRPDGTTDARWFQVQARWDEESFSIINRDFTGQLQHWM